MNKLFSKIAFLFSGLIFLMSCERVTYQDEVVYAVTTGKSISSISIFNAKDELLHKYDYIYDSSGNVVSVDNDGVLYTYQYDDALLVSISCDDTYNSTWVLTYDENHKLDEYFVYMNGDFVIKYTFDYDGDRISCFNILNREESDIVKKTMSYAWEGFNLASIGSIEFTYKDIIDNFNVPIPELQLPSYGLFLDPLFDGFSCSENLIQTSKASNLNEFEYLRNEDGDICRIDVDSGRLYYIIEYAECSEARR